jgi:negative regulator of sigma E activity
MVIRRALKDPALRATWGRYALIGACVRGEPMGSLLPQTDVAARVRARLAAEPEHVGNVDNAGIAAAATARRRSLFERGALGGVIAAGVAGVSLVMMRMMGPAVPVGSPLAQQPVASTAQSQGPAVDAGPVRRPVTQVAAREQLPSYTTPVDDSPSRRNAPLVSYVVAHNEVAASAVRFAPLSSVMNGSYDLAQDAVEMTAAEVGARR